MRARDRLSRRQNGCSASAPLPSDKDHTPGVQIQNDCQILLALGDGDLIDSDLSQVLQLGPGEALVQKAFLDVLDQVPTDIQMPGYVQDGHMP